MNNKMIGANKISNSDVLNARSQARLNALIQTVGKGKRKKEVLLSKGNRKFLVRLIGEMKKQMAPYENKMKNVFDFFNYLESECKKKGKDPINFNMAELDFLRVQIKETVKGLENLNFKWYQFVKKGMTKVFLKQNKVLLDELK